jgi:hypothetical protein
LGKRARYQEEILKGTALKSTLFVLGILASALILALVGLGLGWFLSGQQKVTGPARARPDFIAVQNAPPDRVTGWEPASPNPGLGLLT